MLHLLTLWSFSYIHEFSSAYRIYCGINITKPQCSVGNISIKVWAEREIMIYLDFILLLRWWKTYLNDYFLEDIFKKKFSVIGYREYITLTAKENSQKNAHNLLNLHIIAYIFFYLIWGIKFKKSFLCCTIKTF